jgi:hypothetical protein
MEGYTVKFKRVDTGKYWIGGNVKEGKYGLQAGMKKTPELTAYLDSIPEGGWINFSIDKPYEGKAKPQTNSYQAEPLDDSLPF